LAAPEKSRIHTFALSPDGRYLAIAALTEGKRQLWVRPLDTLVAQPLRGTEDATYPFWSPDGRSIGFFAEGKLKRIGVEGGPAQILCDAPEGRGGTWNRNGVIIFAPSNSGALQRVAAVGGARPATKIDAQGAPLPSFLPDGNRFLYVLTRDPMIRPGLFGLTRFQPPGGWLTNRAPLGSAPARSGNSYCSRPAELCLVKPAVRSQTSGAGDVFPRPNESRTRLNHNFASISANGVLVIGWSFFGLTQLLV
jgi:hypothetical protein